MFLSSELNTVGADKFVRGDFTSARSNYIKALSVERNYLPALANLAAVLGRQDKLLSAVAILRRIVSLSPGDYDQWNNLANVLIRLERYDEATECLSFAQSLRGDSPQIIHNLAIISYRTRDYASAQKYLERLVDLGNDSDLILHDLAHALMAQEGHFRRGLEFYESRWNQLAHLWPWDYHIPEWKGEDLTGKRLLFHSEQGFGDAIMCSRFAKDLSSLGAEVTLGLPTGMKELFDYQNWEEKYSIDSVDISLLSDDSGSVYDYHSPMFSAMRHLRIDCDKIDPSPYLVAPDFVMADLNHDIINVGICWASGNRGTENNHRRRVSDLEDWLILSEIPGVQLWSLQRDSENDNIVSLGAEALVYNIMDRVDDWSHTAAFINQLDLVVSVDTAVVHLAGALGKTCWMISGFTSCWRWWNLNVGSGRPWYDTVRIFSQTVPGDWKGPLKLVKSSLLELGGGQSGGR